MRNRVPLVLVAVVLLAAAAAALITDTTASASRQTLPSDLRRFLTVTTAEVDAQNAANAKAERIAECGLWPADSPPHLNSAQLEIAGSVLANADIVASAPTLLRWLTQLKALHASDPALAAYVAYVEKERSAVSGLAHLPPFNACRFFTGWQKAQYPTSQNAAAVLGPIRYGLLASYAVYGCTNAGVKTALVARLRALGASRAQLGVVSGECIGGAAATGGSSRGGGSGPPPPKPSPGPGNLRACQPVTHIYPSVIAGPAGMQITLNFSSDPNPAFDGFTMYAAGTAIEFGGGYPTPLKVLLKGSVGQKEAFVLVREYNNAGIDTPTCVSARALVTITSGAVKASPPPPPVTPSYPRCPVQVPATLTPASGPSGTPVTLQFVKPVAQWAGFYFYVSSGGGGEDGGGFPGSAMHFVATGDHGQKIVYTLVQGYLNGSTVEPGCIAAQATFTIS